MTQMDPTILIALATNAVSALAIALGALWLSGIARRRIAGMGEKNPRLDVTLMRFAGSVASYLIMAVAAIFILGRFGIETTSLAALLGAAGLAIGLALQGTLSNVAAGVMLIGFRPFKVGDYITAAGQSGTVSAVTLFTTELTTPDNVQIIVPNGDIFSSAITNYSYHKTRRCDLVFGVSYDSDLKTAETIIRDCIKADPRAHATPEPFVKVSNLGDSSVDFTVRVWCDSGDFWGLKFDLTRAVKEGFDTGGIEIPFPTQTVIRTAS
ncbi:mechanosensitive ion channel domain-containing protein [Actibacterium sp. MT2.3-13A]|uniref:mechanosensitive ion channel family protein n=1 Tax=Actibacterium sp. MT2.3-13A TaxID=2828332 RepID=UPI001BACF274|nr:mechanosensitive ion channel domain-containing protein [Actibacterium sp. MT2.3-13A]